MSGEESMDEYTTIKDIRVVCCIVCNREFTTGVRADTQLTCLQCGCK